MADIKIRRSDHTISCKAFFSVCTLDDNGESFRSIEARIIACEADWLSWVYAYENDNESLSVDTILDAVSRLKKSDLYWLNQFAAGSPDTFKWQLYERYLLEVDAVNPLRKNKKKVVGGSPVYSIKESKLAVSEHNKKEEMFRLARWLYVLFRHWRHKPTVEHHEEVKLLCSIYGVKITDKRPLCAPIIELLSTYYRDVHLFSDNGESSLYSNHIKGKISRIERSLQSTGYILSGTPLAPLLK